MLSRPISLAILDDHALFRKTLRNFLSEQRNIHVAIQAPDLPDLLRQLKTFSADVLLLDLFIPGTDCKEVIRTIRGTYPAMRILILSMCTDMNLISDLLDTGIHGFISKADEPEELLQAICDIADNRIYRNKIFTEALYWNKQVNIKRYVKASAVILNERERKILQLLWEEKSNKEIADELFLGVRSVEKIRQDLKEKIGVKSTVGLLKYAMTSNIIHLNRTSYDVIR